MNGTSSAIRTSSPSSNPKGIPLQRSGKSRPVAAKKRRPLPPVAKRQSLLERIRSDTRLLSISVISVLVFVLLIAYAIRIAASASEVASQSYAIVERQPAHRSTSAARSAAQPPQHALKSRQASSKQVRKPSTGDLTDEAQKALKNAWSLEDVVRSPPSSGSQDTTSAGAGAEGAANMARPRRTYEELKRELEGIDIDELNAVMQAAMRNDRDHEGA